jgi:hypothetical protein
MGMGDDKRYDDGNDPFSLVRGSDKCVKHSYRLLLSFDDYDDFMMVIDDAIHLSPIRIYCAPNAPIKMSLPVYTGVVN